MKVICIGGTNDGKVVNVRNGWTLFDLPEETLSMERYSMVEGKEACTETYKVENYIIENFCVNNRTFQIARHSSLTLEESFVKLLDNYKP